MWPGWSVGAGGRGDFGGGRYRGRIDVELFLSVVVAPGADRDLARPSPLGAAGA
jgi:hypothetical protein